MTLTFETWTDFASDCGQSRHWGGVHFTAAVEASAAYCSVFGDMAYDYYLSLMDGTAPLREPAQSLAVDPWLPAAQQAAETPVIVPENTTPTPMTCENVSESVVVTAVNNGVICEGVDTTGLSLLAGYLDAVVVSGELDFGVQVCFNQRGSIAMLESNGRSPHFTELTTYENSGMTCSWVDRPGTVVLIASSIALGASGDSTILPLSSCDVITRTRVNFRATPGGDGLNIVIPTETRLNANARTANWFNVQYEGQSGWISADFTFTFGNCG